MDIYAGYNYKIMDKRLIINADDFGLCKSVNKGIVEAHTKGVLTSATIMANMPAAEQAVEFAKNLPDLGVGVHLNLTSGKPVSQNQCVKFLLNAEGNFGLSPGKLALASLIAGSARKAIETELSAQAQWVIEHGIKPTHLDSHKHIHAFPLIFRIVCRLAKRLGIPAIRYTYEPKQVCHLPWPFTDREGRKRASLVRTMAKITHWQNRSFFRTDALFGVAHTGKINMTFLRAVALYNQAATAELMTHPGYTYDLDATYTRLVKQREVELETLCSEKIKQCFKDTGVKLVNYGWF
jgi:predicted glycoside hydrolase/deacetylase ChbG (UPF0249 family)